MPEFEVRGMKCGPRKKKLFPKVLGKARVYETQKPRRIPVVELVSDDGISRELKVRAYLMKPPCFRQRSHKRIR